MNNVDLAIDEVILLKLNVFRDDLEGRLQLNLTSKKMVFQNVNKEIIDVVFLDKIKIYNKKVQVEQKNTDVYVQTIEKNFTISFENIIDAMKFVTKTTDAVTGTTMSERGTEKINEAFNKVDDVLGFNSRDTMKSVIETGIAGTLLTGIGLRRKKKNKK